MTSARLGGFLAVAVGPLGWCVALGAIVGGDPMLGIEIAGAGLVILWAGVVIQDLTRSRRLASALSADALEVRLFDVPCRITPALGADAIVVGSLRPRIFVGQPLLATLLPMSSEPWSTMRITIAVRGPRSAPPPSRHGSASLVDRDGFVTSSTIDLLTSKRSPTPMRFDVARPLARSHGRCSRARQVSSPSRSPTLRIGGSGS